MIGDIAHVCNRGVEKRKIFLDENDYIRFVDNLYLLNNKSGKLRTRKRNVFDLDEPLPKQEKLVDILKWSLLPNQYHLLLSEVTDGGISEFARRLGNAYTKYFNTKNDGRSGFLFQNKAKIVPVTNDRHFIYLPIYIDLNPLDILFSNWKDSKNFNNRKAFDFVKNYKWSSLIDFYNEGPRTELVNKKEFYELLGINLKDYEKEVIGFLTLTPVRQHSMLTQVEII